MAMKWHGEKVQRKISGTMQDRLDACAMLWDGYAKQRLNQQVNRGGGNPSAPGGYPAMVTSHLRRNVMWERLSGKLAVRVGTNVKYGKYLELGTRRMAKRPWMTLTNRQTKDRMRRILGRKMRIAGS